MSNKLRHLFVCGGSLLALAAGPQAGFAQATKLQIDEILVTAQKREEGLQDVPIAINVLTGANIARMSFRNLEEISSSIPGFHMYQSPAQSGINIRSIGSGASNQGIEQQVGLFVDGVYAGRDRIFQAPFLDIERIEVIKGPQTVILGKNTTAGAINITTAKPTDHFEGLVSALYGEDDEYEVVGVVSGPLSDQFAVRVAGRVSGMGGYIRNTFTGKDEPNIDDAAVRGTMRWRPNEDLTILFKAEYARSRQDGNALAPVLLTPGQLALAKMFDPNFQLGVKTKTKSADSATLPSGDEYNDLDSYNFTLTIDYDMADWTLISISAYGSLDYEQATDGDHLPIALAAISLVTGSEFEQYSQELRLASPINRPLEVMTGVYYQRGDTKFLDWIPCVKFASVPGPGLPSSFCAPARWQQQQDTYSAFMRATWNITDALSLNGGLRYTHEKKTAENQLTITQLDGVTPNTNPFDLAIAAGVGGWVTHVLPETKRSENSWSPSVNLQYNVTPDVMFYASFVRGTKSGGFNPLNGTGSLAAWEFDPEKARSFEIGAKTTLFDNRAAFNIAAFSTKITDFQVSQFGGVTFIVTNAGSAKVDGVELDFRWRATEELTLSGAVSYIDARYGSFVNAPCMSGQTAAQGCVGGFQNLSGRTLEFAPDWSGTLAADYSRGIGSGLVLNVSADVFYSDGQLLGPDLDPRTFQSSYAKINARIGIGEEGGGWEIAVIGKNLTDKVTKNFMNDIIGFAGGFFAHVSRGRSFAVQGTMRF